MTIPTELAAFSQLVDSRLAELLPSTSDEPSVLFEAMRYSALAPGKRLRPALCISACKAVGGSLDDALDAACSLELIHCFSLIHDDLPAIDDDDMRRGMPTCHVKFGEAVAILAGDALFALAFETLGSLTHPKALACVKELSSTTRMLVAGETLDVISEGIAVSTKTLEQIHLGKTASLIACSCVMGGLLGGGSNVEVEALREYGTHLGLAFQIADDVLNETGTPEELGKAAGSDASRQKATYPAIFGLEESRKMAQSCTAKATAALVALSGDTGFLSALAAYAVARRH